MKQYDLNTLRDWKQGLELASRKKPISHYGEGPYHTHDTKLAESQAELLGQVLNEFVHLLKALEIYEEACGLDCTCAYSECRHCHLVYKARLEMQQVP